MKESATILDSTSSNRSMWKKRISDKILWIDIEPELSRPPDIIVDCTKTNFEDKRFHTIFFDPPHKYGEKKWQGMHSSPSQTYMKNRWGHRGAYYGFDKFQSKTALLGFINKAQQEFYRILTDDGILWFKWSDIISPLNALLPIFRNWDIVLRFEVAYRGQTKGSRVWWVAFMKNPNATPISELTDFCEDTDKEDIK